jgi:hypothetical protein
VVSDIVIQNFSNFSQALSNYTDTFNYSVVYENIMEKSYSTWCAKFIANKQIDALNGVQERFSMFFIALIIYFITEKIIDKIIYSDDKGIFKILRKEYPFKLKPEYRKIILFVKDTFFYAVFAMTLIYYLLNPIIVEANTAGL